MGLGHGFESLLKHILTKFCPSLLHWPKIHRTMPRHTVVHWSTEGQKRRPPKAALSVKVGAAVKGQLTKSYVDDCRIYPHTEEHRSADMLGTSENKTFVGSEVVVETKAAPANHVNVKVARS